MWTMASGGSSCACWPSRCSSLASSPSGEEEGPLVCAGSRGSTNHQCSVPHWVKFPCPEFSAGYWTMAVLMSLSPWQQGPGVDGCGLGAAASLGGRLKTRPGCASLVVTLEHVGSCYNAILVLIVLLGSLGVQGQMPSPSPGGQRKPSCRLDHTVHHLLIA